jgi:hypothetical protein
MSLPSVNDVVQELHKLMLEFDNYEDLDEHPIRKSAAYEAAVKRLGWDIDWDAVAEKRMEQG